MISNSALLIAAILPYYIAEMLPLAAILQLSEYATSGNQFILWQYFDFAKGYFLLLGFCCAFIIFITKILSGYFSTFRILLCLYNIYHRKFIRLFSTFRTLLCLYNIYHRKFIRLFSTFRILLCLYNIYHRKFIRLFSTFRILLCLYNTYH